MTLEHVHQLRRVKQSKGQLYMCVDPHCTYKEKKKFLHNKAVLCNGCREEFVMDVHALRVAEPKCIKCRNTKEAKKVVGTMDKIKGLFKEGEATI